MPYLKWEAMINHHRLSDLFFDFGKGPKRVFKILIYFLLGGVIISFAEILSKNPKFGMGEHRENISLW